MTDDHIKLVCDLKQLQRDMILMAAKMGKIKDEEVRKHGRELNGAAAMIGNWLRGMK